MPATKNTFSKILIIQTAFIGDVVLATAVAEKLHEYYPEEKVDFLVRQGNESLFDGHPFLNKVLVWNKRQNKYGNFFRLLKNIRREKYDWVINLHRFGSSGFLTAFSGAKIKSGFTKNPFSFAFTHKFEHTIGKKGDKSYIHETERNHQLIQQFTDSVPAKPKLYPSAEDYQRVSEYTTHQFITVAPASVWFTKQYPKDKWINFLNQVPVDFNIYLLGGKGDFNLCEEIKQNVQYRKVENLAGKLDFLESAALMADAAMNYVNDSAPMHFASAMNAPVTAVYCSTIPEFGFGPLSDISHVVEIQEALDCRPCGLHGYKASPKGHFKCARNIKTEQLLATLPVSA